MPQWMFFVSVYMLQISKYHVRFYNKSSEVELKQFLIGSLV